MGTRIRDSLGRTHSFETPPERIVSLVPSLTETLFALGAGARIVGITDFCVHPRAEVASKPRVGGTKNPSLSRIRELRPDLVLANREENRRRDVERLEGEGIPVFVTYARTVEEALHEIRALASITLSDEVGAKIVQNIERALGVVRADPPEPAPRVVALVWKGPLMAVGGDTFANDMLEKSGGSNPFASSEGRYPRIREEDLVAARPEILLLPTEPYAFTEEDRLELLRLDLPAAREHRIHIVAGELLSWYGPRIARGLEIFSGLIRR